MNHLRILAIVALCAALPTRAMEEENHGISVRLSQFAPPGLDASFRFTWDDAESDAFHIPQNGFSQTVTLPGNVRNYRLTAAGEGDSAVNIPITFPEEGSSYIILVLRHDDGTHNPVIIRADDDEFKAGTIMIFNLATKSIGGDIGAQQHQFEPGSRTIIHPNETQERNQANYQVRFYDPDPETSRVYAVNLWPYADNKRIYVFLYHELETGAITYRAIDEFVSWVKQRSRNAAE